jgi:hypothetical protein
MHGLPQFVLMQPENLAQQAPSPVPDDGRTDLAAGDEAGAGL